MVARDCRPRYPPDGTVRAGRRSRHRTWPAAAWPPRKLSDVELVCLPVAQVLLGARSEHHRLRMCRGRLGHLFPYLPHQPGYHKRLKAAAPLICKTAFYLATLCPSWADGLRLLDATRCPAAPPARTQQANGSASRPTTPGHHTQDPDSITHDGIPARRRTAGSVGYRDQWG
jgi:hypothetical protein